MRHLERADLLPEFRKRLAESDTVDIAVAWATICPALDALLERAGKFNPKARVIVGISGNATRPLALQELQKKVTLHVTSGEDGLFHPKFYLFKGGKKSVCWTGSANLTNGGFGRNDELVHEFNDRGYAQDWFDRLFESLGKNSKKAIADYIVKWKPTGKPEPRSITAVPSRGHPISLLQRKPPNDWPSYFAVLNRCDAYWNKNPGHFTVLDEGGSYLNTITEGNRVISRRNWINLTRTDAEVLLGHRDRGVGSAYGLLGSMKWAGKAKNVFLQASPQNLKVRQKIDSILKSIKQAKGDSFAEIAGDAIARFNKLSGFGSGVATRLITLARPDRAISVNDGSRIGLSALSGLAYSTLAAPKNYTRLLKWLYEQPWYQSTEPSDGFEARIWSMRAALIDSFVYGYEG